MYLNAASLPLLLSLICFGLTAQEASSKGRNSWQHRLNRKLTPEVGRKNTGNLEQVTLASERRKNAVGFEQPTRMEMGAYSRPNRLSNREKRSGSWEGSKGFYCGGDIYIPTRWVCDGENDCPVDRGWVDDTYIPTDWICDGEPDCPDQGDSTYLDEYYCFDCGDGHYINHDWFFGESRVCDGKTDCANGLDEADCFDCGYNGSKRADGISSIQYIEVCDGSSRCNDDSDENCLACGDGNSIPFRKFCDGTTDCTTGRDEDCFECGYGEAIHFSSVCNGDNECTNGLDEADCFECGDGKVINADRVCNGYTECKGGLDEKGLDENGCQFITCRDNETEEDCLNATSHNEHHYFRCNSGYSTFQVYRCDGVPDCEDESDELDCYGTPCPEDYYTCPDKRCKSRMYFCEYVYTEYTEFRDRSDYYCPRAPGVTYKCHNYTCFDTVNMFQCTTGECIKASDQRGPRRCNLFKDCPDGSDELACENNTCSFRDWASYRCASGQCYSDDERCDGQQHCPDNADEMECDDVEECIPPERLACIACDYYHDEVDCDSVCDGPFRRPFQCLSGQCINNIEDWCDHKPDCPDGSDEISCENHTCEHYHFRCNSGQCILSHKQCDNQVDCFDGSDEANCQFICPSFHLRCDDDRCYPIYKRCNGLQDCLDNSDENNCVNNVTCPYLHSNCEIKRSQCIPWVHYCDGKIDCNDTSDELGCDYTCPKDGYYKCSDERCITLEIMCNYTLRIEYGSVFTFCSDSPDNITCTNNTCDKSQFRCNTGHCISKEKQCDLRVDCPDRSDEDYCESECDSQSFNCSSGQCIARMDVCDSKVYCSDGSDERSCYFQCTSSQHQCQSGHCIPMTGLCNGYFEAKPDQMNWCPVFHDDEKYCPFRKCPSNYLRMPTGACSELKYRTDINCSSSEKSDVCTTKCPDDLHYIQCCNCSCVHRVSICDGVQDCPDGADERNCGRVECRPDQFYCGNITCFPIELRCDGYNHCSHGNDETNCILNEKTALTGHDMTMKKTQTVVTQNDYQQECFDPSVCFTANQICQSTGQCNMEVDNADCFLLCSHPCACQPAGQLFCKHQTETNNASVKYDSNFLWPFNISSPIYGLNSNVKKSLFFTFETISTVSITYASLRQLPTRLLSCAFNIQHLNMSHNAITHISVGDFGRLYLLALLDLSNNLITSIEDFSFKGIRVLKLILEINKVVDFGIDLFSGMAIDRTLMTDDYRFCCIRPAHLPEQNCFPGPNQFSSCKDLMKNTVLSTLVWIVGFITLFGNIGVILLMITVEKESLTKNHGVMVTNLAVADVLMGVYLLSIGSVDAMYRDIYITKDYEWRNSVWCSLVGVICMISSEASVFFICLITVDRYLIVKYPFGQVRLSRSNIIAISLCIWLISIAIAVIPLAITPYFKGEFFSKSSVCIALPLTTESFGGWEYSFTISVCLNFIMLVIVGVGQFLIVREIVLAGRNTLVSTRRRNDFSIAVKLTFVVLSDVCCWVPISVLGIMALTGFEIHPDTYAWVVVLVLPVNSALNPFFYTLIAQLTNYLNKKNRIIS